jgi:hypothetical protein
VKYRLHPAFLAVPVLLLAGIGVGFGVKVLDRTLAILILGVYLVGSAILVLKSLGSAPVERRKFFSCGELALLPQNWRRWMLDEKVPPRR